jgi:ubiquinone/menaquinone biosynthesis C-methylase UbiE
MSLFLSLRKFRRLRGPVELAVEMAGIRMGERVVYVGVGDPRVFALVASRVGLTGRACAVVEGQADRVRLERAAARQGVLVEVAQVQAGSWPYSQSAFDVAIVDANALARGPVTDQQSRLANTFRVVRPGGRVLAIRRRPRGLASRLGFEPAGGSSPRAEALALVSALEQVGCKPVRVLAEREGLLFVEGFRPNR